ncbi:MAG: hypothetical protein ACJ8NS_15770 [Chthoniobacterales bacterium]
MRGELIVSAIVLAVVSSAQAGPCASALSKSAVCEAANNYALERMKEANLEAIVVMQDVRTGALVAFAASDPAKLDVTTELLPLSPVNSWKRPRGWIIKTGATRSYLKVRRC